MKTARRNRGYRNRRKRASRRASDLRARSPISRLKSARKQQGEPRNEDIALVYPGKPPPYPPLQRLYSTSFLRVYSVCLQTGYLLALVFRTLLDDRLSPLLTPLISSGIHSTLNERNRARLYISIIGGLKK